MIAPDAAWMSCPGMAESRARSQTIAERRSASAASPRSAARLSSTWLMVSST